MKIVLDTNVIVAAFATQGLCHAVFEFCLDQQDIVLSSDILKEVADVLKRKLKVPPQVIQETYRVPQRAFPHTSDHTFDQRHIKRSKR